MIDECNIISPYYFVINETWLFIGIGIGICHCAFFMLANFALVSAWDFTTF